MMAHLRQKVAHTAGLLLRHQHCIRRPVVTAQRRQPLPRRGLPVVEIASTLRNEGVLSTE